MKKPTLTVTMQLMLFFLHLFAYKAHSTNGVLSCENQDLVLAEDSYYRLSNGSIHFVDNQMIFSKSQQTDQLSLTFKGQDLTYWGVKSNQDAPFQNNFNCYKSLLGKGLQEGIDISFYENQDGLLEYDFIIAPGTDYQLVRFQFEEKVNIKIDPISGDLIVLHNTSLLKQEAPFTYQEVDGKKIEIPSAYKLHNDGSIGFELLATYDTSLPLVIDPVVMDWATLLPYQTPSFNGMSTAKTADGCVITSLVIIPTASNPAPTIPGAFQTDATNNGGRDLWVGKICSDGTVLDWSTYISGSGGEGTGANSFPRVFVTPLPNGNIAFTMSTTSNDLPVTDGSTYGSGLTSVYSIVLDANGAFVSGSYIAGGNGAGGGGDSVAGVTVDANGNLVYLIGSNSTDLPVSAGAYDPVNDDLFVAGTGLGAEVYLATYDPNLNFIAGTYFEFDANFVTLSGLLALSNGEIAIHATTTLGGVGVGSANPIPIGADSYQNPNLAFDEVFGFIATFSNDLTTLTHLSVGAVSPISTSASGFVPFHENHCSIFEDNGQIYVAYDATENPIIPDPNGAGADHWVVSFPLNDYSQVTFHFPLDNSANDDFDGYIAGVNDGVIAVVDNNIISGDAMAFAAGETVTLYDTQGNILYGTYLNKADASNSIKVCLLDCGEFYVFGNTSNAASINQEPYLTQGTLEQSGNGSWIQHFQYLPPDPATNILLNTATLEATSFCINGTIDLIDGEEIDNQQPDIYCDGELAPYPNSNPSEHFVWEYAASTAGPWTPIPGSDTEDFVPPFNAQAGVTCYRRVAYNPFCPDEIYPTDPVCITVDNTQAHTVDLGADLFACPGDVITLTGTVTISPDGDFSPYTYNWTPTNFLAPGPDPLSGTIGAGGGSVSVDVTVPNNGIFYLLEVTDNRGCLVTEQVSITTITVNVGQDFFLVCDGVNPTIGPALVDPNITSFLWIPSDGDNAVIGSPTDQNPTIDVSGWADGECRTYTLQLNGCTTVEDEVEVCKQPTPTAPASLPPLELCVGSSANLGDGFAYDPAYNYTWTPLVYIDDSGNPTTEIIPLDAGLYNYQLTIEDPATGCVVYLIQEVSAVYLPQTAFDSDFPLCREGGTSANLGTAATAADVLNGVTYSWSVTVFDLGNTDPNIPSDADALGFLATGTGDIEFMDIPTAFQSDDCYDLEYVRTSTAQGPGGLLCERTDTAYLRYCPTCEIPAGCFFDLAGGQTGFCGGDGNIIQPGYVNTDDFEYVYSPVTGLIDAATGLPLTPGGPHNPQIYADPATNTTYTLGIVNLVNPDFSCTVDFEVFASLETEIGLEDQVYNFCPLQPNPIGFTAVAGIDYEWTSDDPIAPFFLDNPASSMPTFTSFVPGTYEYTVIATDPITGCGTEALVTVNALDPEGDLGEDVTFCAGNSGAFVSVGTPALPGYTYNWTSPDAANLDDPVTSSTNSATIFGTTTFTLEITNEFGCVTTQSVTYTDEGTPTPAGCSLMACEGGVIQLGNPDEYDPNLYSFSWTGPGGFASTEQAPTVTIPTGVSFPVTYVFTVSALNGDAQCSASANCVINELPAPTLLPDGTACDETTGLQIGVDEGTLNGGPSAWSFVWDNFSGLITMSSTGSTLNVYPSSTQTYNLTTTEIATGCEYSFTYTVNPAVYDAELDANLFVCYDDTNPTLCLNNACTGGCTYNWVGGMEPFPPYNTSDVSFLSTTTADCPTFDIAAAFAVNGTNSVYVYTLEVTDGNGCTSSETMTIWLYGTDQLLAGADQTICGGETVMLGVTGLSGYSYSWTTVPFDIDAIGNMSSTSVPNPTVSPTQTTTYQVTYTDPSGNCTSTDLVTVSVPAQNPELLTIDVEQCESDGLSIDLTNNPPIVSNTGNTTNYFIDAGTSIPVADETSAPAGTYYIVSEDVNGCDALAEVTATINENPVYTAYTAVDCATGEIYLVEFAPGETYDITMGSTYTGTATYATATAIPVDGILDNNVMLDPNNPVQYTIRIFNEDGCYLDQTVSLQPSVAPLAPTAAGLSICETDNLSDVIASGDANAVFSWFTDATLSTPATGVSGANNDTWTPSISSVGTETVYVIQNTGVCDSEATEVTVTIAANPAANVAAQAPDICDGEDAVFMITGTPDAQVSVTVNGSASTVTLDASGNGMVTVSGASSTQTLNITNVVDPNTSCSDNTASSSVVTVNAIPTVDAGVDATIDCNNTAASITATSDDGNATFMWSDGTMGATLNTTIAGTYTVTVTSAAGCEATDEVEVMIDNAIPSVDAGADALIDCNNASATLTASSDDPNASFLWSDGSTGSSITTTAAGSYTVTVTSANGCSATDQVEVIVDTAVPSADAGADALIDCNNTTVTLSASSDDPNATFTWSNGDMGSSITTNTPGSYSVTVTSANGCSATDQVLVSIDTEVPSIDAGADATIDCNETQATLTASSDDPNATFMWNDGTMGSVLTTSVPGTYSVMVTGSNGCTATDQVVVLLDNVVPSIEAGVDIELDCNEPTATIVATASGDIQDIVWSDGTTGNTLVTSITGTYAVTVTGRNGCTAMDEVTITANFETPSADAGLDVIIDCNETMATLTATSDDPNATFMWSDGTMGATTTTSAAGMYAVTVTSANGCSTMDEVEVLLDTASPTVDAGADAMIDCNNAEVSLTATSSDPNATFEWSDGTQGAEFTTGMPGTYTVMVTGENGCTAMDEVTINIDDAVPTVDAGINQLIDCTHPTATLTAISDDPNATFEWSDGTMGSTLITSTAGMYTVTVTTDNGCSAIDEAMVVVATEVPTVDAGIDATIDCGNEAVITASSSATGDDVTYEWSDGTMGATLTASAAGMYAVTVTTGNGCSAVDEVMINVNGNVPSIDAGATVVLDCNDGNEAEITATSDDPNATFEWSNGTMGATLTTTVTGTYSVTVTSIEGCSATDQVTITTNTFVPTIDAGVDVMIDCEDPEAIFTATSSDPLATFEWSDGTTGATLTTSIAGMYSVTVTGANGCQAMDEVEVIANAEIPVVELGADVTLDCTHAEAMIMANVDGENLTYEWNDGSTGTSINATEPGLYSVTVTAENGCMAMDEIEVLIDNAPPTADAGGDVMIDCNYTVATLVASSDDEGATYEWSDGTTGNTLTTSTPGMYSVTVTSSNGCTAMDEVMIGIDDQLPNVDIGADIVIDCDHPQAMITATTTTENATFTWSDGSTGSTITATAAGTYAVTIMGENGCMATDEVNVSVGAEVPTVDAGLDAVVDCTHDEVNITATSDDPNATFMWSDGTMGATLTTSAIGNYTVTVTSENGCMAMDAVNVSLDDAVPTVDAGADMTLDCEMTEATFTATSDAQNVTFEWSDGTTGPVLTATSTGTYTVTVMSENGCSSTDEVTLTAGVGVPDLSITSDIGFESLSPNIVVLDCNHDMAVFTATSDDPEATFEWSDGSTGATLTTMEEGTYNVVVTSVHGCPATEEVIVIREEEAPIVNITGDLGANFVLDCNHPTLDLTATADMGNVNFEWSDGSTGTSISINEPGEYSVMATGENGCPSMASITISQNVELPAYSLASDVDITGGADANIIHLDCSHPSATVNVDAVGANIEWNDGFTGASYTITSEGTYTVMITGENGCEMMEEIIVTRDAELPTVDAGADIDLPCGETEVELIATSDDPNASFLWNDGTTGASLMVTAEGLYTVTAMGENGCMAIDEVRVSIPQEGLMNIESKIQCDEQTGEAAIVLAFGDGTPPYMISGDVTATDHDGSSISFPIGSEPGSYSFTIVDSKGCTMDNTLDFIGCRKLAVELVDFSGEVLTLGNQIQWITATETGVSHFELLHSTDGSTFETIATVDAAGESQTAQNYSFLDKAAPNGLTYYQLQVVDLDGTITLSEVITLSRKENSRNLSIVQMHPIPTQHSLNISLYAPAKDNYELRVFNALGQLVINQTVGMDAGLNDLTLAVDRLDAGVFLLQISDRTGQEWALDKFVVK